MSDDDTVEIGASGYNRAVMDIICERMVYPEPRSLNSVCKDDDVPTYTTIMRWLADDANVDARDKYARAMSDRADRIFEELIEIADTPQEGEIVTVKDDGKVETRREDMLGHRRLQVDARKWALARMSPKKYGDKIEVHQRTRTLNKDLSDDPIEAAKQYQDFIKGE